MRAVLFVDDEQRVLDGLRRGLRGLRHDWDLRFALGGEEGVEALDDDLVVVVSDMRMPGLDGADLLLAARDRAPRAARVILSGNSDRLAARRAAFVAHRFVAKPCDAATLAALLPALSSRAETADEVPAFAAPAPLPGTVVALRTLLDRPDGLPDVARLVDRDPGFALTLLHAASSPFFGPARACEDATAAVEHLGALTVRDLLEGTTPGPTGPPPDLPAPAPGTSTARALAALAPLLPPGGLLPALELRGLAPALVGRVAQELAAGEVAA